MRVVSGYRNFTLCTVKLDRILHWSFSELQVNDILFPQGFDLCEIGSIWRCFLCRWQKNRGRKALWCQLNAYFSNQLPYKRKRKRSKPSVYSADGLYKWFTRVRGPAATQATIQALIILIVWGISKNGMTYIILKKFLHCYMCDWVQV